MEPCLSLELLALCALAGLAGFVDAVVGGGGLIQLPALLVLMPQLEPVTLLGTNKFVSIWGTSSAAWQYARRLPIEWRSTTPTIVSAFLCSFAGARTAALIPREWFRPLILMLLLGALAYTLARRQLGERHAPRLSASHSTWLALGTGALIGFYDGFLGPGTGSFLIFAFVGLFGFSFLAASASAKLVNVATNLAALLFFVSHGKVHYAIALPMAASNLAGGLLGSHLALRRGSGFIRSLFLLVVSLLIARYAWDIYRSG